MTATVRFRARYPLLPALQACCCTHLLACMRHRKVPRLEVSRVQGTRRILSGTAVHAMFKTARIWSSCRPNLTLLLPRAPAAGKGARGCSSTGQ